MHILVANRNGYFQKKIVFSRQKFDFWERRESLLFK
jgi:hypothetical protein